MGWYLQQFSKLLIDQLVPDLSERYLAMDGDLIFTRPLNLTTADGKIVMPQTTKSPKTWAKFIGMLFGENNTEITSDKIINHVVGWMVLDRNIVHDFIATINRNLLRNNNNSSDHDHDVFPWKGLHHAEDGMDDGYFFSEFYIYARFALQHPSNPYVLHKFPEPSRNPGNFQKTCILRKKAYYKAQNYIAKLAPWLIWEEHKQHALDLCPKREKRHLENIGIWHDFHQPPWGGGNQFLLALRHGLEEYYSMNVVAKSDVDGKQRIENSSQVLLANGITFGGKVDVLERLKEGKKSSLALVHRIDGPYYVARYFQSLNFSNTSKRITLPEEDQKTLQINQQFACATVFQSQWSLEANLKIGLTTLRNPVVIPNTVNPSIFYPSKRPPREGRKLVIVATSHSANVRKGFDTMMWLDAHMDFGRFELVYMGGKPKTGFAPRNIQKATAGNSESVAEFLRTGDIYLAPSRYEPASNAVMEALACGLPVLYQEGSSHGDLVGRAGAGFDEAGPGLLQALDTLVTNYEDHVSAIDVPSMEEVAKQYLSIMRWCSYMKHVML
jgi:glycosyltransferase involved in cell wall biosynthesis